MRSLQRFPRGRCPARLRDDHDDIVGLELAAHDLVGHGLVSWVIGGIDTNAVTVARQRPCDERADGRPVFQSNIKLDDVRVTCSWLFTVDFSSDF